MHSIKSQKKVEAHHELYARSHIRICWYRAPAQLIILIVSIIIINFSVSRCVLFHHLGYKCDANDFFFVSNICATVKMARWNGQITHSSNRSVIYVFCKTIFGGGADRRRKYWIQIQYELYILEIFRARVRRECLRSMRPYTRTPLANWHCIFSRTDVHYLIDYFRYRPGECVVLRQKATCSSNWRRSMFGGAENRSQLRRMTHSIDIVRFGRYLPLVDAHQIHSFNRL